MSFNTPGQIRLLTEIIDRFHLSSLQTSLEACKALAQADSFLDVAVLGQFKSGKSTLLNTLLGEAIFPVSVLPATAVITRAFAGEVESSRVHYLDGRAEDIPMKDINLYVTEAGNPHNHRQVAFVDVMTLRMQGWPGIRLVDTPGLGSLFAHNTETTRAWMPNIAVALVAVSVERPLSDEDRRLIDEACLIAPRVVVVLTKVDLLSESEFSEVTAFVKQSLQENHRGDTTVLPFRTKETAFVKQSLQENHRYSVTVTHFSARIDPTKWVTQLRESVLDPVTINLVEERNAVLMLKLSTLTQGCRDYLAIGLHAAQQADADRDNLRSAVLDESVNIDIIRDELRLAAQGILDTTRPAFEKAFALHQASITSTMTDALAKDVRAWKGNLSQQTEQYQQWVPERLQTELAPVSASAGRQAADLLDRAEGRMRRVIEAFRDRLGHNIAKVTGIAVTPASWVVKSPAITTVSIAVRHTFMTHWDLLWWLLPMWLVGGMFRRHILSLIPWEVEKNLVRLASDWTSATDVAIADLRKQAEAWADNEVTTLSKLLSQQQDESLSFRKAISQIEE